MHVPENMHNLGDLWEMHATAIFHFFNAFREMHEGTQFPMTTLVPRRRLCSGCIYPITRCMSPSSAETHRTPCTTQNCGMHVMGFLSELTHLLGLLEVLHPGGPGSKRSQSACYLCLIDPRIKVPASVVNSRRAKFLHLELHTAKRP